MPQVPKVKLQSFKGGKVNTSAFNLKPTFGTIGKPQVAPGLVAQVAPPPAAPSTTSPAGGSQQQGGTPYSPGVSGILEQTRANIAANLASQVGGINQAENAGANEFGFAVKWKPTVGPNGEREVESIAVDPANPFSRAALLQRSYDQAKRGSTNSYAARGQLYSGALQNAQDENTFGFQRGDDQLRRAFASFILGQEGNRSQAVSAAGQARIAAASAALSQQLAMPEDDPGPQTGPGAAPEAGSPAAAALAQTKATQAAAALKPRPGYSHVMTTGPRAGQSFNVVKNKDGSKSRVFANGSRERI